MKHMKKANQFTKRIMSLLLAIALLISGIRPISVHAAVTNMAVEAVNFRDFSNWRSGNYNCSTGKYAANAARLCLTDYVSVNSSEYIVRVSNSDYHLLIRELDANKKIVKSYDLINGKAYIPSASAHYLGISIYNAKSSSGITYTTYSQLFANGFYAGLESTKSEETSTTTPSDSNETENSSTDNNTTTSDTTTSDTTNDSTEIENKIYDVAKIDYKDFSNWRVGNYSSSTGRYSANKSRLCLNDYVTVSGGEYKVCVKDVGYHLLIRELNSNKAFIKSYNLANGQSYTPSANAAYLGISIYKLSGESSISYNTFKTLFANGFYAGLEVVEEEEAEEEEEDIILDNGATDETASTTTFRDELKKMILTGDMTTHDISKYGMTYRQVDDTWEDLKANECYIALNTYGAAFLSTTKNSSGIVQTIYIYNSDSDFVNRYQRTCAAIDNFLAGVDSKMTDLDKILYAHEYIVKNTTFRNSNDIDGCAGGVLGDKRGRCQGFAEAMRVLLHEMGISSYFITSSAMNHGWIMVELNGQYYHIDATWDNTRSGTDKMYYHKYLMRNDNEFLTINSTHYSWYCSAKTGITSTSTKYVNWFVHDVVGCMYYYDGLWYYQDLATNSIVRSDVNGNQKSVVVDGSNTTNKIRLSGITSGVLKYTVNGSEATKNL